VSILDTKRKRDVRRQRGQFIAVAVTIGLGVMLFASTYDAYLNLDDSYNFTYDRLNFADMWVVGADPGFEEDAATITGVETVETRYEADLPFRVGESSFIGRAVGYPSDGQPEINKIDVRDGGYLDPDDESKVVIESHMATEFGLGVGDTFEVLVGGDFQEVEVVGVAISAEYIWPARSRQDIFPAPGTFGVAFISSTLFEGVPPELTSSDIMMTYQDDVDVVATDGAVREAAQAANAGDVIPRANQASHSTLQLDVQGFEQLAFMFPALFMFAAGLSAFVLLTRLVISQRTQIGTMRASGMGRKTILRHYLSYGTRLGLIAGLIGLVIGMVLGAVITAFYTAALGIPDTVRSFHWVTPIVGVLFGLAAGSFGAYAPARRAFKLSPAEAMRGDIPAGAGRRSLFETVFPPFRGLPVRWKMVLRGIGRSKRRSFSTVLGVVLALTLVMVSWGMIDTMQSMIDRQFDVVATEDANVILSVPAEDETVRTVLDVSGVDHTEVVSTLQATVSHGGESYSTSISGYPADTKVHDFPDGLPGNGILAGQGLADLLDVEIGDEVVIELPALGSEFRASLRGFLDEPMGTFLYTTDLFLESKVDEPAILLRPGVAGVKALFVDGATDRDAIISNIEDLDTVAVAVDARQLVEIIEEFTVFFYMFVGVMLIFGGAMAFALMFNTISVNVAERKGEFATMRANGLSHSRIARLIASENILLTSLGLIPGILIGYLTGAYFMASFSSDVLSLDFSMNPLSIVLSAVAMLVTAGLSLIPALRTVRRLDISEVVRERAA
jgi:putative ABC transport system permease protein